jgi:hypothetical protein
MSGPGGEELGERGYEHRRLAEASEVGQGPHRTVEPMMMTMMMMMMMLLPNPPSSEVCSQTPTIYVLASAHGTNFGCPCKRRQSHSFVYLNFIQITKTYIPAGCFQFILKEHNVSETHLFRPQVKGFEEAFIQLVSLETVTRFLQN